MGDEPRCGYTVLDDDGIEQPCDRPATGWRWYQDVEHEDCLDPACDWHANEGGRRIHRAEAAIERVRARCETARTIQPPFAQPARTLTVAEVLAALDRTEATG